MIQKWGKHMRKATFLSVIFFVLMLSGCVKSSLTYEGDRYILTDEQNTYQFENKFIYKNMSQNYTQFTFSFTDTHVNFVNNSDMFIVTYANGTVYECARVSCVKSEGTGVVLEPPMSFRSLVPLEHTGTESGLAFMRVFFFIFVGLLIAFGLPFAWSNDNAKGLIMFRARLSLFYRNDVDPSAFGIVVTRVASGILALIGFVLIIISFLI
jgi:hypothetical protein